APAAAQLPPSPHSTVPTPSAPPTPACATSAEMYRARKPPAPPSLPPSRAHPGPAPAVSSPIVETPSARPHVLAPALPRRIPHPSAENPPPSPRCPARRNG